MAETDTSGHTLNEFVFFAGRRVGWIDHAGNQYYVYADHVGTTRTITQANGTVCYDADFTPNGQEMVYTNNCPSAFNYKFTGGVYPEPSRGKRDPETGLDYAFARYYNSRLGRFMGADPLGGSIFNPQTLNRYPYVRDNPTSFVDPLGLFFNVRKKVPGTADDSWSDGDLWAFPELDVVGVFQFQAGPDVNPDLPPFSAQGILRRSPHWTAPVFCRIRAVQ